jgi:hypothetical protein
MRAAAASHMVEYPFEPPISSTSHPAFRGDQREQQPPGLGPDGERALREGHFGGPVVVVLPLEAREHGADAVVEHAHDPTGWRRAPRSA